MKKFLMTLAILVAMVSNCFAAHNVDVCDFDSDTFFRNYNHLVRFKGYSNSVAIDESMITSQSNQYSETVIMPLKNFSDGEGAVIGLVIDQQGYIWEFNLQNYREGLSDDMTAAFEIALYTIGLEPDEMYDVVTEMENTGYVNKYFPGIGKYLEIDGDALKNRGVGRIEILAHSRIETP
jgi:hypothetical protein